MTVRIKGLGDKGFAMPQVCIIRKGGKKVKNASGKEIVGPNLKHFRFDFADSEPEAAAIAEKVYGKEPNNIHVLLPASTVDESWDCTNEAYVGGVLIHSCNCNPDDGIVGEIQFSLNYDTGERVVRNGRNNKGEIVQCPHKPIPYTAKSGQSGVSEIKPIGRLTVMLPIFGRAVQSLLLTHGKHDVSNITRQLLLIQEWQRMRGLTMAGIELIISRKPCPITYTDPRSGKRIQRKEWLIVIEIDPDYMRESQLSLNIRKASMAPMLKAAESRIIERLNAPLENHGPEWTGDIDDDDADDEIIEGETVISETPAGEVATGQSTESTEETSKWQVAYEGLQLPKAIHDAKLKHCNGDYEAAYKFSTKG